MPVNPEKAACFQAALRLLGMREHSAKELTTKLILREYPIELILEVIIECQEKDWQSDERYCDSYIRAGISKRYGPNKISNRLMQQGVAKAIIEQYLLIAEVDWFELARAIKLKKYNYNLSDFSQRQRCQRFLYQRGFDNEMIRYAMEINI